MIETSPAPSISHDKPPAILSLIGDTPLVEITQIDTGPCHLFLKLENQNPGGSIKDRIALSMIEAAEREGHLGPGGTVIEATAGNTGLGLALVAGAKGYRVLLVIPDKMSQEKISHVKALGAEVRITRSDVTRGHPEYYQDMAARLAEEIPGGFYVNQFGNPANPLAHDRTTGPEIWRQGVGPSKASAKISFPTSRTCRLSRTHSKSTTRKASQPCASYDGKKEFSVALPPERSWLARCVIAGNKRNRNASSASLLTLGTNIFPRCTTISGWRNRVSSIVRRTGT